jgi:hypothetical protein
MRQFVDYCGYESLSIRKLPSMGSCDLRILYLPGSVWVAAYA